MKDTDPHESRDAINPYPFLHCHQWLDFAIDGPKKKRWNIFRTAKKISG